MSDLIQILDEDQTEPNENETATKLDSWCAKTRAYIKRIGYPIEITHYCPIIQKQQVSQLVCITKRDSLTRNERSKKFLECARRYAFVSGELERAKHKPVSSGNKAIKRRLQKNESARAKKKMKESLVVPTIETIFALIDERKQMAKRRLEVEQKLAAANASNRVLQYKISRLACSLTPPGLLNCRSGNIEGEGNITRGSRNINDGGANGSKAGALAYWQKQGHLTPQNSHNVAIRSIERSIEHSSETTDVANANKKSERTTHPSFSLPSTSTTQRNRYARELLSKKESQSKCAVCSALENRCPSICQP